MALSYPSDPFAALGLSIDATPQAIKARYYQLARKYHPSTQQVFNNHSPTTSSRKRNEFAHPVLSEHFHRIYDAYTLLSKDSQRKRYIEWAALEELETTVETHRHDLEYIGYGDSGSDESSDLDDFDIAHRRERSPGLIETTTTSSPGNERRSSPLLSGVSSPSPSSSTSDAELRGRVSRQRRASPIPQRFDEDEEQPRSDSAQRLAADRRRKLNRIKRKEVAVFEAYRDAKLLELEAQIEAERLKDIYDKTKAKRESIEKIPMENSTRVRMVRNILKATRLLKPSPQLLSHARRLSLSTSLLNDNFVGISSPLSAHAGMSSQHRRGISLDITQDQTDSDEEPTQASFRHPFRSPAITSRKATSRERSPIPAPTPVRIMTPTRQSARVPAHASAYGNSVPTPTHPSTPDVSTQSSTQQASTLLPTRSSMQDALGISFDFPHKHHHSADRTHLADPKFRLFVKRPTGFDEQDIIEDLTSPISPEPTVNKCRELIHLPLGISLDDPADAANGHSGVQLTGSDPDSLSIRQNMLEVKVIGDLRFPVHIPADHVHKLNIREESLLLGKRLDADTDPKDLLRQIDVWDPALARRFMVKPDIKASFAFRLVCDRQSVRQTQTHNSFIALSYRRKKMVKRQNDNYSLPLSCEMMQAVWEERESDEEGLWVDQISINQDDDHERAISMSAMDLVYRGARLIVVVLDDFEFEQHEVEVLTSHLEEYEHMRHVSAHKRFRRHSPPWLESHEQLFQIIKKILSAAWFRRAWCRHEMRLSQDLIFLIPCRSVGAFRKTILRLSSACLAHLLALAAEVALTPAIEILKPALHAFFRDRTEASEQKNKKKKKQKDSRSHHGNFTTVAAEVFRMEAGGDPRLPQEEREADARVDRMSITLNAMECGLMLRPLANGTRQSLSNADCYYSLLMLALAARDPGALCSAGKPLVLSSPTMSKVIPSWLFEPTIVDAGLNNYKTLTRLPLDSLLRTGITRGAHWVQLDLKFLGDEDPKATRRHTAEDDPEILDLAREFVEKCIANQYGRHRRRYLIHDAKANDNFGSMKEVYVQTLAGVFCCGPDWMSSICQRYGVGRWKQDLESAYWLMVTLRSINQWPQICRNDWTTKAASFIMDFVNFMVVRGMPQRQLKRPEVWRPIWITTGKRGKLLTFAPAREGIFEVIPSVLLDAEYRDLARMWFIEPRTTPDKWTLLGKSVLFGDESAKLVINTEDEMVRHQQKVYGRGVDAA